MDRMLPARVSPASRSLVVIFIALAVLCCTSACGGDSGGSSAADARVADLASAGGNGPRAVYLPVSKKALNFPFPHDAFTLVDPSTPSGRRLNLPLEGDTALEIRIRELLNAQDGFDPLTPMQLSFDEPVDLATLAVNRDTDPTNDTVFVLNVDPRSPRFGERVAMDLGQGNYPIERPPRSYFPNDPLKDVGQYEFPADNREDFYEDRSDTFIMRPIAPLAPSSTHAVIFTRGVRGEDGEPLRSPHAPHVALDSQYADLDRALPILAGLGVDPSDIAYAYTFTTGTPTHELEQVESGLMRGEGPLGYLRDRFPVNLTLLPFSKQPGDDFLDYQGNDQLLDPPIVKLVANIAIPLFGGGSGDLIQAAIDQLSDLTSIRYFVQGTYRSPFFLGNADVAFQPEEISGERELRADQTDDVPWFLAVPKPTERNGFAQPPYPVCIFQHPNSTSRLIALAISSVLSDFGFATIGIDAAENGPIAPYATDQLLELITSGDTSSVPLAGLLGIILDGVGNAAEGIAFVDVFAGTGRTPNIDFNGDGQISSGEETYTGDIPTVRDVFRQTVVDSLQLTRILRSFGQDRNHNGKLDPDEGDFDGDGIVDVGGANAELVAGAESLGTFMTSPFLAISRDVDRAALNVPGGGAIDFVSRIDFSVVNQLFVQLFGPAVVGRPSKSGGGIDLTLINDTGDERSAARVGPVAIPPGTVVRLVNLDKPDLAPRTVDANADGTFMITFPADPGNRLEVSFSGPTGESLGLPSYRFTSERQGFGVLRNTPSLRTFATITQTLFGSGDGANYATHWTGDPLPGRNPKQALIQLDPADFTVPTSTGLTLARAANLISPERMADLVSKNVAVGTIPELGIHMKIPELPLAAGNESEYPGLDYDLTRTFPFENRVPGSGLALHLADNHEYLFAASQGESGPVGAWLTIAAQAQIGIFLERGEVVIPFRDLIDELRAKGRDIPRIPGVDP